MDGIHPSLGKVECQVTVSKVMNSLGSMIYDGGEVPDNRADVCSSIKALPHS